MACYIGVRIQEYNKLNRSHLVNDGTMFKIRIEKTSEEDLIPLQAKVKRIQMKYNGMSKVISTEKFNEYLKAVCRFGGFDELVQFT